MIPGRHWQELVEVSEIGHVEQYRRKMKIAVLLLVAPAVAYLAVIGVLEIWRAVCA
jgi:hypothetical protein